MNKIIITLFLCLIISLNVFSQDCLAPASTLQNENKPEFQFPKNWKEIMSLLDFNSIKTLSGNSLLNSRNLPISISEWLYKRPLIVDMIFDKDRRDALEYASRDVYFNNMLGLNYIKLIENSKYNEIIRYLEKFKNDFRDDISANDIKTLDFIINNAKPKHIKLLKSYYKKNNRKSLSQLLESPAFDNKTKKHDKAVLNLLRSWISIANKNFSLIYDGKRKYRNKQDIQNLSFWEIPIWPVTITIEKKSLMGTNINVHSLSIDMSALFENDFDLHDLSIRTKIRNDFNLLKKWLKNKIWIFSDRKRIPQKWITALKEGKVLSLAEITGEPSPRIPQQLSLFDNMESREAVQKAS